MQNTNHKSHSMSTGSDCIVGPRLSPKKRKFIEYLKSKDFNDPEFSELKQTLGISKSTYYRWLKDRNLQKVVNEEGDLEFREGYRHILRIIKSKALQGDHKSIKLYLDIFENIKDLSPESMTPDEVITLIKTARKQEMKEINDYKEKENEFKIAHENETGKKTAEISYHKYT